MQPEETNQSPIRIANRSEADAIARLINLAFQVERPLIEGDRTDADQVLSWFDTGEFLVSEEAGRLVGCVYLELRGERAYLGLLSVDPIRQGKGIGATLMAASESRLVDLKCRYVDLRVLSGRPELFPFYAKLGYLRTGTSEMPKSVPLKVPCLYVHHTKQLY